MIWVSSACLTLSFTLYSVRPNPDVVRVETKYRYTEHSDTIIRISAKIPLFVELWSSKYANTENRVVIACCASLMMMLSCVRRWEIMCARVCEHVVSVNMSRACSKRHLQEWDWPIKEKSAQNEYTLKGWRSPPHPFPQSLHLRLPLPLHHDKKSCSPCVNESQLFSLLSVYSRVDVCPHVNTAFTPFRWDSAGGCFHLGIKEIETVRLTKQVNFN